MSAKLRAKLRAVEALYAGATTPGEREAAARALGRLHERLAVESVPRAWYAAMEDARRYDEPDVEWADDAIFLVRDEPDVEVIVARLRAWAAGRLTADDIHDWACEIVDKVLLPDLPPGDPRSIPVEVVLQLASMAYQPLHVGDVPALVAFLRCDDPLVGWRDWLAYLGARFGR